MIQLRSKLTIADNSGAKKAKCISVVGKGQTSKKLGTIGSILLVTLSNFFSRKKIKKRMIYIGLIVTRIYWTKRGDGTHIKFSSNNVLIFSKQNKFIGSRLYGIVAKEIIKNPKTALNRLMTKIFSYTDIIV